MGENDISVPSLFIRSVPKSQYLFLASLLLLRAKIKKKVNRFSLDPSVEKSMHNVPTIQTRYAAFVFNHRVLIGNNGCQRKIDGENIDTLALVQKKPLSVPLAGERRGTLCCILNRTPGRSRISAHLSKRAGPCLWEKCSQPGHFIHLHLAGQANNFRKAKLILENMFAFYYTSSRLHCNPIGFINQGFIFKSFLTGI